MTDPTGPDHDLPPRPPEVLAVVDLARSGRQAAAAEQFAVLADSPDPLTAWSATAALLPWFWWHGEFTAAARRVERTVVAVGPAAGTAALPKVNTFVSAFAAAAHYENADPVGPFETVIDALPQGHPQRQLFERTWRRVVSDPGGALPEGAPEQDEMLSGPAALAARGLSSLSASEVETVMLEAINRGQRRLVLDWIDAGVPVPARAWALIWVAEMLVERGQPERTEPLLVREASAWVPSAWWQTVSWHIPLALATRPLITPAVLHAHLEQPVAVGVS